MYGGPSSVGVAASVVSLLTQPRGGGVPTAPPKDRSAHGPPGFRDFPCPLRLRRPPPESKPILRLQSSRVRQGFFSTHPRVSFFPDSRLHFKPFPCVYFFGRVLPSHPGPRPRLRRSAPHPHASGPMFRRLWGRPRRREAAVAMARTLQSIIGAIATNVCPQRERRDWDPRIRVRRIVVLGE